MTTDRSPGRIPTMADVASAAGVSRALVSIVMRDVPGASDETRHRVRQVAETIGYRPHAAAQVLRRARSNNLGVLFTPRYPFEVEIAEAMYPVAEQHGFGVVLGAMTPRRDLDRAVDELLAYRCEALALIGIDAPDRWLSALRKRVPVVRVGRPASRAEVDVVHTDEKRGIDLAVAHLAELGHQRIAFIDGGDLPGAKERRAGYTNGMRRRGLAGHVEVLPGRYTDEGGAAAAAALLSGEMPTAVIASNDWSAVGALTALLRAGVRVPDDVSVVGYDNSELAHRSYIDLTSVGQDVDSLASETIAAIDRRLADPGAPPVDTVLPPSLVVRTSTARPRPDTERITPPTSRRGVPPSRGTR